MTRFNQLPDYPLNLQGEEKKTYYVGRSQWGGFPRQKSTKTKRMDYLEENKPILFGGIRSPARRSWLLKGGRKGPRERGQVPASCDSIVARKRQMRLKKDNRER